MRTEKYNTTQYFFVNSSAVTTMSLLLILTLMLFQGCKGDIVIIYTGMQELWNTPTGHERPALSIEATEYLVIEKGIHCIGTDATGLEVRGTDDQPVHQILFANDVAMIESMTNLDKLSGKRFSIMVLPIRVKGMDSCPVRIVASEK